MTDAPSLKTRAENIIHALAKETQETALYRRFYCRKGDIREAVSVIKELLARDKWQPIETVPRDGSTVLLTGKTACVAHYESAYSLVPWVTINGPVAYSEEIFTHWKPISFPYRKN